MIILTYLNSSCLGSLEDISSARGEALQERNDEEIKSSLIRSKTLKERNETQIKRKYGSLWRKIADKLKEVDHKNVRDHLESIFYPEDIGECISNIIEVRDMFKALEKNNFWSYGNITKLRSVADEFIEGDDQMEKEMDDYDDHLVAYVAATSIREKINLDSFKQHGDHEDDDSDAIPAKLDPSYYQPRYRKELKIALYGCEGGMDLSEQSLKYLEAIWERLRKKFHLSLGSVLDHVKEGCVEVVWYIPSTSAQQLLDRLEGAEEFFQEIFVSTVQLEDALVYSTSVGVVSTQVGNQDQL